MQDNRIPEFAIIGHPNEGKSAVVSTLAEDDSVRVSPYPGETVVCQTFPVKIDGREIIRFTDTPGFQNPKKVLTWMKNYHGANHDLIRLFLDSHKDNPDFKEVCELFQPVARGAGIIYVVDGSRPVRRVDLTEMEILRLTGCPRMAIINCKEDVTGYLDQWKTEFRKHFNAIRLSNAHRVTYAERIVLLENLKGIEQDWEPALETVISAFKEDWRQRNALTAEIICNMIENCLTYRITKKISEKTDENSLKRHLREEYNAAIEKIEKNAHQKIRRHFKHNVFNYDLPPYSILHEDLFSKKTWQVLGLTPRQLITAAGVAGGALGGGHRSCRGRSFLRDLYRYRGARRGRLDCIGRRETVGKDKDRWSQSGWPVYEHRPCRRYAVHFYPNGPGPDLLLTHHQLGTRTTGLPGQSIPVRSTPEGRVHTHMG